VYKTKQTHKFRSHFGSSVYTWLRAGTLATIPAETFAARWLDGNKNNCKDQGKPRSRTAAPAAVLSAAANRAGAQHGHIWSAASRTKGSDLRAALANLDTIESSLTGEDVINSEIKKFEPHAGRIEYLDKLSNNVSLDFVGLNETKWKRHTDWVKHKSILLFCYPQYLRK